MDSIEYISDDSLLRILFNVDHDCVTLKFLGKCALFKPGVFLDPIFTDAYIANKQKILIDVSELEFMNSATMVPIMRLIEKVLLISMEMEIKYDDNIRWQNLTFPAFNIFAKRGGQFTLTCV